MGKIVFTYMFFDMLPLESLIWRIGMGFIWYKIFLIQTQKILDKKRPTLGIVVFHVFARCLKYEVFFQQLVILLDRIQCYKCFAGNNSACQMFDFEKFSAHLKETTSKVCFCVHKKFNNYWSILIKFNN